MCLHRAFVAIAMLAGHEIFPSHNQQNHAGKSFTCGPGQFWHVDFYQGRTQERCAIHVFKMSLVGFVLKCMGVAYFQWPQHAPSRQTITVTADCWKRSGS